MRPQEIFKILAATAVALVVMHWFSAGQDNIINPEPTVPTTSMETP